MGKKRYAKHSDFRKIFNSLPFESSIEIIGCIVADVKSGFLCQTDCSQGQHKSALILYAPIPKMHPLTAKHMIAANATTAW